MSKSVSFLCGIISGGLAGATLGFLSAPKSGRELRRNIIDASENIYRKVAYELEEIADQLEEMHHQAEVIDANNSINVEPLIDKTKIALNEAEETTARSQKILEDTYIPERQGTHLQS